MSDPIIAEKRPGRVTLEKSKEYRFCSCGSSKNQPFCDGSHTGSDFSPITFKAEEDGDVFLCNCKYSKNLPFCDGSHKQFSEEDIGKKKADIKKDG